MYWKNGFGLWGNGFFHFCSINVKSGILNIHIHWSCTHIGDGPTCGCKGVWCSNDLIPRSYTEETKSKMQCGGPTIDCYSVLYVAESSKLLFEICDIGSQAKTAAFYSFFYRLLEFLAYRGNL